MRIRGIPRAIFEISAVENGGKPIAVFSITQLMFIIDSQHFPLSVYFQGYIS